MRYLPALVISWPSFCCDQHDRYRFRSYTAAVSSLIRSLFCVLLVWPTCRVKFMIRDSRMRAMVHHEPITPVSKQLPRPYLRNRTPYWTPLFVERTDRPGDAELFPPSIMLARNRTKPTHVLVFTPRGGRLHSSISYHKQQCAFVREPRRSP